MKFETLSTLLISSILMNDVAADMVACSQFNQYTSIGLPNIDSPLASGVVSAVQLINATSYSNNGGYANIHIDTSYFPGKPKINSIYASSATKKCWSDITKYARIGENSLDVTFEPEPSGMLPCINQESSKSVYFFVKFECALGGMIDYKTAFIPLPGYVNIDYYEPFKVYEIPTVNLNMKITQQSYESKKFLFDESSTKTSSFVGVTGPVCDTPQSGPPVTIGELKLGMFDAQNRKTIWVSSHNYEPGCSSVLSCSTLPKKYVHPSKCDPNLTIFPMKYDPDSRRWKCEPTGDSLMIASKKFNFDAGAMVTNSYAYLNGGVLGGIMLQISNPSGCDMPTGSPSVIVSDYTGTVSFDFGDDFGKVTSIKFLNVENSEEILLDVHGPVVQMTLDKILDIKPAWNDGAKIHMFYKARDCDNYFPTSRGFILKHTAPSGVMELSLKGHNKESLFGLSVIMPPPTPAPTPAPTPPSTPAPTKDICRIPTDDDFTDISEQIEGIGAIGLDQPNESMVNGVQYYLIPSNPLTCPKQYTNPVFMKGSTTPLDKMVTFPVGCEGYVYTLLYSNMECYKIAPIKFMYKPDAAYAFWASSQGGYYFRNMPPAPTPAPTAAPTYNCQIPYNEIIHDVSNDLGVSFSAIGLHQPQDYSMVDGVEYHLVPDNNNTCPSDYLAPVRLVGGASTENDKMVTFPAGCNGQVYVVLIKDSHCNGAAAFKFRYNVYGSFQIRTSASGTYYVERKPRNLRGFRSN